MVLSRLNGRCSSPVGMDATLNGRLGFNLERTCGTERPACPVHVACYNSKVRRFCSLMSDKAPVYLLGSGIRWGQQASGAALACRQWLHVAWDGSKSVGRTCRVFYPALGRPVLSIASPSFLLGLVFAIRPSAIWIFPSSSARYNTVARTDCWLMDRWACATSAVPIQFGFQSGPWHPCADAILQLFYGVVNTMEAWQGQTLRSAFEMCIKQSAGHEPRAAPHCCRRARTTQKLSALYILCIWSMSIDGCTGRLPNMLDSIHTQLLMLCPTKNTC